jgi:hypothetical protein
MNTLRTVQIDASGGTFMQRSYLRRPLGLLRLGIIVILIDFVIKIGTKFFIQPKFAQR